MNDTAIAASRWWVSDRSGSRSPARSSGDRESRSRSRGPAPDKAGKDLRELLKRREATRLSRSPRPPASSTRRAVPRAGSGKSSHVHRSRLESVADQIGEAVDAGFHVVSTCEELSFPGLRHAGLARALDARAGRRASR